MFEFTQSPLLLLVQPGARLWGVHLFYICHFIRLITHTHARTQAHIQTHSTWLRGEPVLYMPFYTFQYTHAHVHARTQSHIQTHSTWLRKLRLFWWLFWFNVDLCWWLFWHKHTVLDFEVYNYFASAILKPVEHICHFICFSTNTRTCANRHKHRHKHIFIYKRLYVCLRINV